MAGEQIRVLAFWHSLMNKTLTLMSNMFCNLNLTDMETCYKAFRTDLLKSIPIRSDRFGFEPEIVMKCAKRKLRIYEVPISYHGRTYEEGKKIGWKDGVKALGTVLHFWLIDDLYIEPYGRGLLNNLTALSDAAARSKPRGPDAPGLPRLRNRRRGAGTSRKPARKRGHCCTAQPVENGDRQRCPGARQDVRAIVNVGHLKPGIRGIRNQGHRRKDPGQQQVSGGALRLIRIL